ncbi:MAG: hypothetical protein ACOCXH_10625 [Cyclobacteriaceae bacterium]
MIILSGRPEAIEFAKDASWVQLYHLAQDHNVYDENPEIIEELEKLLEETISGLINLSLYFF